MEKILFLDIDGVLNSVAYDRIRTREQGNIDETRLPLIRELIEKTNARIVLTSSWRKHWSSEAVLCDMIGQDINQVFATHGLQIYDKTPALKSNDRAAEIRLWLSEHEEVKAFAIFDDIAFGWGEDLREHLVTTNPRIGRGLEQSHVDRAAEILTCRKGEKNA